MGLLLGRKPEHEAWCFSRKVAAGGDEGYLVCAAVAAAILSLRIGSPLVFCNVWLFMCA